MWITTQWLQKRLVCHRNTGKIHGTSKREKLKELQLRADQQEICKSRRHKPEQTESEQEKQKLTNKFACSSLTWKTPVKKQMISLTPVQCSPASNARDVFHPTMPHLTGETLGQKLCVERSADHNINDGVLNRSNEKIDIDFVKFYLTLTNFSQTFRIPRKMTRSRRTNFCHVSIFQLPSRL